MYKRQESETTLESVNRQIIEIKKKVQLADGQRKAHYEEWDTEKRLNAEKIRKLKDQIKHMYEKLAQKSTPKTSAKIRYQNEMKLLLEKSDQEAWNTLDLKVIDVQKKLDLLRHQRKEKEQKLSNMSSANFITSKNTARMNKEFTITSKEISAVENRTNLIELNGMEADHLRKKYRTIKNQLIDESVAFESVLNKLEQKINDREVEISRLQKVYNEAKSLKDITFESLNHQEQQLLRIQSQRNSQLEELKSQVEDHKFELERLERQMFSNQHKSMQQISESDDDVETEYSTEVAQTTERLDTAFFKLKEATGVTENENVLRRFLSQRDTTAVLTNMKNSLEKEKQDLEKYKEEMSIELETCKFVESQINEQNKEETIELKSAIQEEVDCYTKIKEDKCQLDIRLANIMKRIYTFCIQIQEADSVDVPRKCPPPEKCEWLLHILRTKLESATKNRKRLVFENETKTTLQTGDTLNVWSQMAPISIETRTSDIDDEEEDVPTRNSLKKEAQLIYETKSRRKGFRIHATKNIPF